MFRLLFHSPPLVSAADEIYNVVGKNVPGGIRKEWLGLGTPAVKQDRRNLLGVGFVIFRCLAVCKDFVKDVPHHAAASEGTGIADDIIAGTEKIAVADIVTHGVEHHGKVRVIIGRIPKLGEYLIG